MTNTNEVWMLTTTILIRWILEKALAAASITTRSFLPTAKK